jgi:hypothetical protein
MYEFIYKKLIYEALKTKSDTYTVTTLNRWLTSKQRFFAEGNSKACVVHMTPTSRRLIVGNH